MMKQMKLGGMERDNSNDSQNGISVECTFFSGEENNENSTFSTETYTSSRGISLMIESPIPVNEIATRIMEDDGGDDSRDDRRDELSPSSSFANVLSSSNSAHVSSSVTSFVLLFSSICTDR